MIIMKKTLSIILALSLVISAFAAFTFAGSSAAAEAEIPYIAPASAPTIDGTIADGEWANAKKFTIDQNTSGFKTGSVPFATDYYYFWNENGLYVYVDAKDTDIDPNVYTNTQVLNGTDGIQIEIDPMNKKNAGYSDSYIFDFVPQSNTTDSHAIWYEHFQYATGAVEGIIDVQGKIDANGYVMEILIKWDALRKNNEDFVVKTGLKMGFGNIIMNVEGGGLYADYSTICDAQFFNTLVLVGGEGVEVNPPSSSEPAPSEPDSSITVNPPAENKGGCGNKA